MKVPAISFFSAVFISFLVFLYITTSALADWEFQYSGVENNLLDVDFFDENYGWAVGDNSTILKTSDGGVTWVKQQCPIEYLTLEKIQSINENIAFCCGHIHKKSIGHILYTADGGKTWIESNINFDVSSVWDLVFINKDEGWIAIEYYKKGSKGKILHTSDGGKTWETQLDYDRPIWAITFINDKIGWANGFWADSFCYTHVLHTIDGGKNWNKVGTIEPNPRWKLYTIKGETLWALPGHLSISKDSGFSWQKMIDKYENNVQDIYPISSTEAYLWILSGYFHLEYTYDLGSTTTLLFSVQGSEIWGTAIDVIKNKFVWIVGSEGKIIKYINDFTLVKEKHNNKPYIINLQQNYPNPFNNLTSFKFTLKEGGDTKLLIYDITGRLVDILIDKKLPRGVYNVVWYVKNKKLPTGLYFYELQTDTKKITRKMLMLK